MKMVSVGTSKRKKVERSNKDKKDIIYYCLECGKAVLEGNEEESVFVAEIHLLIWGRQ
ncbi:MAG: hypothetical protein AAB496_01995 [Patescibacteria group bacterium]